MRYNANVGPLRQVNALCFKRDILVYGLYLVVCALTTHITVSGIEYAGSLLLFDPGAVALYIFWGVFFWKLHSSHAIARGYPSIHPSRPLPISAAAGAL